MATLLVVGDGDGIEHGEGGGQSQGQVLPRVTIQFCTQCKWMLRAAYFAQELLSTFGTSLGEVALQPSTGGTFIVKLFHALPSSSSSPSAADGKDEVEIKEYLLWDRKAEGGFPETKELKRRVRDVIDPKRDLGHVDGKKDAVKKDSTPAPAVEASEQETVVEGSENVAAPGVVTEKVTATGGGGEGEVLNARGKIVISGGSGGGLGDEDYGYCKPGDEDCG